jgi:DnaK suppressor protein
MKLLLFLDQEPERTMSHLTTQQLSHLEKLLNRLELDTKEQLHTEAGRRIDEPFSELAGEVTDIGDEASADVMVDIDHAMMGLQLATLRDIAQTRGRIAEEKYGVCIDCGAEVDYERLLVHPTAKRCTACQHMHEHTYANMRHSRF